VRLLIDVSRAIETPQRPQGRHHQLCTAEHHPPHTFVLRRAVAVAPARPSSRAQCLPPLALGGDKPPGAPATGLHTTSPPRGESRVLAAARRLRRRSPQPEIPRGHIRAGALAHGENTPPRAPAVMRGLTDENSGRPSMPHPRPRFTAKLGVLRRPERLCASSTMPVRPGRTC
jgi:hypothetical protein